MSLVDRFRKGGGGFLNNVDGLITNVRFTTNPDFGGDAKTPSKSTVTKLWFAVSVREDGNDKLQTVHLDAGGADEFTISDDGRTITPVSEAAMLWGGTDFLRFYASAVEGGLTEPADPEPGDPLNFDHLVGVRARFIQAKNDDAQKRNAENVKKNKGQARKYFNEAGEKKGKDGKFYAIRSLQVEKVISEGNDVEGGDVAPPTTKPTKVTVAAKTAGKVATAKVTTKGNGKATDVDIEVVDLSEGTLINILAAKESNSIKKTELNLAVTKALVGNPNREAVRSFLYDDVNLAALAAKGIITYDKTQIALA